LLRLVSRLCKASWKNIRCHCISVSETFIKQHDTCLHQCLCECMQRSVLFKQHQLLEPLQYLFWDILFFCSAFNRRARAYTHTHAHARARTHTRTRSLSLSLSLYIYIYIYIHIAYRNIWIVYCYHLHHSQLISFCMVLGILGLNVSGRHEVLFMLAQCTLHFVWIKTEVYNFFLYSRLVQNGKYFFYWDLQLLFERFVDMVCILTNHVEKVCVFGIIFVINLALQVQPYWKLQLTGWHLFFVLRTSQV